MKSRSVWIRLVSRLTRSGLVTRQFAFTLLLGSVSAVPALGSPAGELDPSFGDHGRILLHASEFGEARGVDAFLDSEGDGLLAVATDYYSYDNILRRFNGDGSPDQAFGNQGTVSLDFGDDSMDILDVERLADGRLLIAGDLNKYGDPDNVVHSSGLLARFHADGSPDESFGSGGRSMLKLGGVYESLSEILVQADGRVVVLGFTNRAGNAEQVLAGFTQDGMPDAVFGDGAIPGISVMDVAELDGNLATIVQQTDGHLMACGNAVSSDGSAASSVVLAARIRPNGVRDSTFGNNGVVSIGGWQEPVEIGACLELADGHFIFVGSSGSGDRRRAAVLRLTPDGQLDVGFGNNGLLVLDTGLQSKANSMLLMSDGSLAITGTHWMPEENWFSWADMLVARLDPVSGSIDRGFGDRGVTTIDFGFHAYRGVAVPAKIRQQPDGKLVIIGTQIDRYDWYHSFSVALARIDPYGSGSNGWAGLTDTHVSVPPAIDTTTLNLRRTGGSTGELSVDYRTVDGSATAGVDYVASSGSVTWPDGDLGEKTISIAVLNPADSRSFDVELFNSSGGLATDRATVSVSPAGSATGTPPPTTPPPPSSSSNPGSGGGAIGIELWFLSVLAGVGLVRRWSFVTRSKAGGLKILADDGNQAPFSTFSSR